MHDEVRDLGNVVCSIVGVLGFAPVESLVLVLVRAGVLGTLLRLDLAEATRSEAVVELAGVVARQNADGVIAVVVSEEGASCASCGEQLRAMVDGVAAQMARRGDQLVAAVLVDRIAVGGRWACLDGCGGGGELQDPASSVAAVAAVVGGRRIYGSRDELAAVVAVDDSRAAALAPLIGVPGAVECVAVSVRAVVDAWRRMAAGAVLTDAELAGVGVTLVDVRVRDALFGIADGEAGAAEALWTLLARVLPPVLRVEALTLLAFSAYVRGEGPLAGVALSAALADRPSHRMAGMLDVALQSGVRPEQIRGLIGKIPPAVSV